MANFDIAYGETEIREGGYVNDPVDKGGETHRGVTRKYHPQWPGWKIVEQLKRDHPEDFKQRINDSHELAELAKDLYRAKYWTPIRGDEIPDQHIANKVFDTGVNQGVARSIRYLQESLNQLNRNQKSYANIKTDGRLGDQTLRAMQQFLKLEKNQPDYLLKMLNLMQANHYIEVMRKDPTQERFARGWLNRVDLR
ncbi:MAG: glycosyl hydrolase 108 family protein [Mariniblastus sp.]|nr:glycosyl hydrolase 108 family protein [Mariniblastus sp.]